MSAPVRCWIADSLERIYPGSLPSRKKSAALDVARGERASFQVCLRNEAEEDPLPVAVFAGAPAGVEARVRRVGQVPQWHGNTGVPADEIDGVGHVPGLVPDPLLEETAATLGPRETTSFWITLRVGASAPLGRRSVRVRVECDGKKAWEGALPVRVFPTLLPPRRDFPVTHWFYADALLDRYGLRPWEKAFWPLLSTYFDNLVAHGQDTVYVPVFTPPLDGVKRPSQLLRVSRRDDGDYRFDWRHVKHWVERARRAGIRHFEWTHLFTQWGVKNALRIYEGDCDEGRLLWKPSTGATSRTYRAFLAQFLPALRRFLEREKILERSFFHISDEPHGAEHLANYRRARELVREIAPWMRVMDALSQIEFAAVTDMPVPSIGSALQFRAAGIPSWCYFCCGPRGRFLNRFLDTPLPKLRMAGWLFHRFAMRGFLHWGYNYWQRRGERALVDPFTESSAGAWPGWSYGDTFVVYPGPAGPLDSIRWEIWAESLQDMALLQGAGIEPEAPLLRPLRSFEEFPKTAAWIRKARRKLLSAS